MTPTGPGPDLRSRRAALTDDAALCGSAALLAAAVLPADLPHSAAHLDLHLWVVLGVGLGAVGRWPGPAGHQPARTLLSAALVVLPALAAPVDLGAALHWTALSGTLLSAAQMTGACGAALLALALWGRQRLGGGVWRRQRELLALGRALPGWRLSRRLHTGPWHRVISAPDGSALVTLHVAYGHERGRDVRRVTWPAPTEAQLAARHWPGDSVLWVTLPGHRRTVAYQQEHWAGGMTWPVTAAELAEWLEPRGVPAAPHSPPTAVRAGRLRWVARPGRARVRTKREVLAAGAQVWRDVPGVFNVPGGLHCTPQVTAGLPSGVFTMARADTAGVTVGVWPHPDLPSAQHADQDAVTGLAALWSDPHSVIWAPLLPAGALAPTHWTVGGTQALLRALEARWQPSASTGPQDTADQRAGPQGNAPQWSGAEDPFQVLGLDRSASPEEIRRAWAQLMLDLHPDRTQRLGPVEREAAEVRFQSITAAYERLTSLPSQGA